MSRGGEARGESKRPVDAYSRGEVKSERCETILHVEIETRPFGCGEWQVAR